MSEFETVEVPFVKVGNRRGLMATQLVEFPWLREFVERFPDSFEQAPYFDVLLFIEPAPNPNTETLI
jgi:hypothetical protein